jgi:DnaK suppressor protein
MEEHQLTQYSTVLKSKERELIASLQNREGLATESEPDFFDEIQRAADRALIIESLDRSSTLLRDVRAALARIALGTYGECLRCGEPIAPKRLAAVPWAAFCLQCQEQVDSEHSESAEEMEFAISG